MRTPKNVKIYDNGGITLDRYTAVYLNQPANRTKTLFVARGMDEKPFHPQGFGQITEAQDGRHLGQRISLAQLPEQCQKLVLSDIA